MPLVSLADLEVPHEDALVCMRRAEGFSEEFDRFLEHDREEGPPRRPGVHASELSGCARKIVYSLLAYPRKDALSKNWRQRFQVGHAIHAMVQKDFHKMAQQSGGLLHFEDEVRIAPEIQALAEEWFVNSACDGIFTFFDTPGGPPSLRMGLEIKTEAPDGYAKLRAPKEAHLEQAHLYMKILDLPLMWFFYMNKANQNNTDSSGPFLVRYDPAIWARIQARLEYCFSLADKEEIPPREESMICQFCAFAHECRPPSLGGYMAQQPVVSLRR